MSVTRHGTIPMEARVRQPMPILALGLAICVAGCAADGGAEASDANPSIRPAPSIGADVRPSQGGEAVTGEIPVDLLGSMLADAADRTGVAPSELVVVRGEAVVWSDGALGCPVRGEVYTQALEPGYHLVVAADGVELDYRATERGFFKLCEPDGPPFGG